EYTITITNAGPSPAYQVLLQDYMPPLGRFHAIRQPIPAGFTCSTPYPGGHGDISCYADQMNPGIVTIGIQLFAPPVCDRPLDLENTAVVTAVTTEPTPLDNVAHVKSKVVPGRPCFNVLTPGDEPQGLSPER